MKTETVKAFIFDFVLPDTYCMFGGIGYEYRTGHSSPYYLDCREPDRNECCMQYTISGKGTLMIGKKAHNVLPGQVFLIERPGAYKYYLPKNSDHWEFKWLTLSLPSVRYWSDITDKHGRIIDLAPDSPAMEYWDTLYQMASTNAFPDAFQASALAYSFLMQLHSSLINSERPQNVLAVQNQISRSDAAFQYCLNRIHDEYKSQDLTLAMLAHELQVSSAFVSKLFKEHSQMTFVNYLTEYRLEKARNMLTGSDIKVEEIALSIGIPDANYFARVFRKAVGVSPSQYRQEHLSGEHGPLRAMPAGIFGIIPEE